MNHAVHAAIAVSSLFGANSCQDVLSHNDIHIGTLQDKHHIKLMEISQARVQKHDISWFRFDEKDYSAGVMPFISSGSVDMGMPGVPVLDQGEQGTCVTFSSIAAMDVLIQVGDFISEECSLALDSGLGANYWNGAYYPSQIIDPLRSYGVVQQENCPFTYPDSSKYLSAGEYSQFVSRYGSDLVAKVKYDYHAVPDLNVVKTALKTGKRVLMAFLLDDTSQIGVQGFDVKIDGYMTAGGLWACKQKSSKNYCVPSNAGHEVIIIGFDDKQQLLKIRNSWGVFVGDQGDFYMTYQFFSKMAVDLTVIYQ